MRHIRIIGGIVAGALLVGGLALAAIPNSVTGTYSVCANKTTGALRAIDTQAGKKCTAAEKLISWQQGVSASGLGAAGGAAACSTHGAASSACITGWASHRCVR